MQLSIKMILLLLASSGLVLLVGLGKLNGLAALAMICIALLYVVYRLTKKAFLRAH